MLKKNCAGLLMQNVKTHLKNIEDWKTEYLKETNFSSMKFMVICSNPLTCKMIYNINMWE